MKAKEYFNRYQAAANKDTVLLEIVKFFVLEMVTIASERRAQSIGAYEAVYREQELKWRAFAHLVDEHEAVQGFIKPYGFRDYFRSHVPAKFESIRTLPHFEHRVRQRTVAAALVFLFAFCGLSFADEPEKLASTPIACGEPVKIVCVEGVKLLQVCGKVYAVVTYAWDGRVKQMIELGTDIKEIIKEEKP